MGIETHVHQARTRAQAEWEAVDAKVDAYDAFIGRVTNLPTAPAPSATPRATAAAGTLARGGSATDDRCRRVRKAFAETVRPHSIDDVDDPESVLETVQSEFSDSVAAALAPTTETSFTPELKRVVVSVASTRRTETKVLRRALAREDDRLERAGETVDDVVEWITRANETPLSDLGFAALRRRHESLAQHRERCEQLARRRQEFVRGTTNEGVDAGIRHQRLVSYLYEDFPVAFPVLATVARLDAVCATCQRAVRQHLVRRV
mgnify:FL=1|jgi:hypothetical protein